MRALGLLLAGLLGLAAGRALADDWRAVSGVARLPDVETLAALDAAPPIGLTGDAQLGALVWSRKASRSAARSRKERYQRVNQIEVSLDGVHRHRIPTLKAVNPETSPRMVVAIYEVGENGERPLGSEEGDYAVVDQVLQLGKDNHRQLVLRVGDVGTTRGSKWLAIIGVRNGRLVHLIPPQTVHELRDLDEDGKPEALGLANELIGFGGLSPQYSPQLDDIWEFQDGKYRRADARFGRFHWRRLMDHRRALERPVEGKPGEEQVGLAVSLYLEHERLGRPKDGLVIAGHYIRWIYHAGDRMASSLALQCMREMKERARRLFGITTKASVRRVVRRREPAEAPAPSGPILTPTVRRSPAPGPVTGPGTGPATGPTTPPPGPGGVPAPLDDSDTDAPPSRPLPEGPGAAPAAPAGPAASPAPANDLPNIDL